MYTIFWLQNLKGRRTLGRPRHRCEGNIRKELTKIWWEFAEHTGSGWGLFLGCFEHSKVQEKLSLCLTKYHAMYMYPVSN
jgi:hypothetical protein